MVEKSNLVSFAESELARLEKDEDGMQGKMNKHILQMVQLFSDENHSGFSAHYAISMLNRLLRYLPLSPIEDNPEDWIDCGGGSFQHKRCGRVFKNKDNFDGKAYILNGKVFSDDGGKTWFSNINSALPIDFPYYVPLYPTKKFLVDKDGEVIAEYKDECNYQ